jgi:hypothetical protein
MCASQVIATVVRTFLSPGTGSVTTQRSDVQWLFLLGAAVVGAAFVELLYPLLLEAPTPPAWPGSLGIVFAGLTAVFAAREQNPRLRIAWAVAALYFVASWALPDGGYASLKGVLLPALLLASAGAFIWGTVAAVSPRWRHLGVPLLVLAAIVRFAMLPTFAAYSS